MNVPRRELPFAVVLPLVLAVLWLPAAADVTGTWESQSPAKVLQLHERADGSVLGYLPGGEVFVSGKHTNGNLVFSVDPGDPAGEDLTVIDATVIGDTMQFTASGQSMTFDRTTTVFDEQRLLVVPLTPSGQPDATRLVDVFVAKEGASFLTGLFRGVTRCELFACGGSVSAYTEDPVTDSLTVDLTWNESCAGTATIAATLDAGSGFYTGTYQYTDCQGTGSGNVGVAMGTATRTDDVESLFASLGRLADDMESEVSFAAPHASIDSGYLHHGLTDATMRAELTDQNAGRDGIDVEFGRFDPIHTRSHAHMHPFLQAPPHADFHEQRSGTPVGGGPIRVFHASGGDPLATDLEFVTEVTGAWVLGGNQDPEPGGIALPFLPTDLSHAMFGAWPYGAHGGGHPEGHPGIDFEFHENTVLLAVRSGTIVDISDNFLTPDQVDVELESGDYTVRYHHVDATLAPGISVGAQVVAGQPLGSPGEFCCDPVACCNRRTCAPGAEATCCNDHYPDMGDCDPQTNEEYHHLIHFGVSLGTMENCPWDVMNDQARQELASLFEGAHYSEQLTEPFLCNPDERSADAMPYVTRWDRNTSVSASNPASIVFSRPATYAQPLYTFLDDQGQTVSAGIACANDRWNPTHIEFIEGGVDCYAIPPGPVEVGSFALDGGVRDATLKLDLWAGGQDRYTPTFEDPAMPTCGTPAAPVTDLRVGRSPGGATAALTWTDPAQSDDFVVFESASPDGSFDLAAGIASDGSVGFAAPTSGGSRFYRVRGRNATCGLKSR